MPVLRFKQSIKKQVLCGMRRETKPIVQTVVCALLALWPVVAFAQDEGPREVEIPNPMDAHTWFIIVAIGAFLAWCISYILQLQKERQSEPEKTGRNSLLQQKEELLNRLANLEAQKETGEISQARYDKEFNKARGRLSDVLGRLGRKRDSAET